MFITIFAEEQQAPLVMMMFITTLVQGPVPKTQKTRLPIDGSCDQTGVRVCSPSDLSFGRVFLQAETQRGAYPHFRALDWQGQQPAHTDFMQTSSNRSGMSHSEMSSWGERAESPASRLTCSSPVQEVCFFSPTQTPLTGPRVCRKGENVTTSKSKSPGNTFLGQDIAEIASRKGHTSRVPRKRTRLQHPQPEFLSAKADLMVPFEIFDKCNDEKAGAAGERETHSSASFTSAAEARTLPRDRPRRKERGQERFPSSILSWCVF